MTNNTPPTFPFNSFGEDFTIHPKLDIYSNGRLAISFWSETEWGMEPFSKITVNMPEDHLNEGEVFVKDWAENAPLVAALVDEGWLVPTGREILSGYIAPSVMRPGGPLLNFLRGSHIPGF